MPPLDLGKTKKKFRQNLSQFDRFTPTHLLIPNHINCTKPNQTRRYPAHCPLPLPTAQWSKKAGQAVINQDCTKSGIKNCVEAIMWLGDDGFSIPEPKKIMKYRSLVQPESIYCKNPVFLYSNCLCVLVNLIASNAFLGKSKERFEKLRMWEFQKYSNFLLLTTE